MKTINKVTLIFVVVVLCIILFTAPALRLEKTNLPPPSPVVTRLCIPPPPISEKGRSRPKPTPVGTFIHCVPIVPETPSPDRPPANR